MNNRHPQGSYCANRADAPCQGNGFGLRRGSRCETDDLGWQGSCEQVLAVVAAEQEAEPFYVGAEAGRVVAGASDEPGEGGSGLVAGGQPFLDELEQLGEFDRVGGVEPGRGYFVITWRRRASLRIRGGETDQHYDRSALPPAHGLGSPRKASRKA